MRFGRRGGDYPAAGMNVALEFYPMGPKTSGSPSERRITSASEGELIT